jgi:hypothetical protein
MFQVEAGHQVFEFPVSAGHTEFPSIESAENHPTTAGAVGSQKFSHFVSVLTQQVHEISYKIRIRLLMPLEPYLDCFPF